MRPYWTMSSPVSSSPFVCLFQPTFQFDAAILDNVKAGPVSSLSVCLFVYLFVHLFCAAILDYVKAGNVLSQSI